MSISYLFVDAAYLRAELDAASTKMFGKSPVAIDFGHLGRGAPAHPSKVFFYEAPPPQNRNESSAEYSARAEAWFESTIVPIAELPKFHVTSGWTKRHRRRGPIQKTVDVALAVDLVNSAHQHTAPNLTLLAGDADFVPAVESAVGLGANVQIVGSPYSVSQELRLVADTFAPLGLHLIKPLLAHSVSASDFPREETKRTDFPNERVVLEGHGRAGPARLYLSDQGMYSGVVPKEGYPGILHFAIGTDRRAVLGCAEYFYGARWPAD